MIRSAGGLVLSIFKALLFCWCSTGIWMSSRGPTRLSTSCLPACRCCGCWVCCHPWRLFSCGWGNRCMFTCWEGHPWLPTSGICFMIWWGGGGGTSLGEWPIASGIRYMCVIDGGGRGGGEQVHIFKLGGSSMASSVMYMLCVWLEDR